MKKIDPVYSKISDDVRRVLCILTAIIALLISGLSYYEISRRAARAFTDNSERTVSELTAYIDQAFGDPLRLGQIFAQLKLFTAPPQYGSYETRLLPYPNSTAGNRAERRPRARLGRATVSIGEHYKGLPLLDANGVEVLKAQRELARDLLKQAPYVDSVAEIDSIGRYVFMEPFAKQTKLGRFDIKTSELFQAFQSFPMTWIPHVEFGSVPFKSYNLAIPIYRQRKIDGYIIITMAEAKVAELVRNLFHRRPDIFSLGIKERSSGRLICCATFGETIMSRSIGHEVLTSSVLRYFGYTPPILRLTSKASTQRDVIECTYAGEDSGRGAIKCTSNRPFPIEMEIIRSANEFYGHDVLRHCLLALCIVPSIFVFFSCSLLGNRWALVASEKDRLFDSVAVAVENVTHDFRSISQGLKAEIRLLRISAMNRVDDNTIARLTRTTGQFELIVDNLDQSIMSQIGESTTPLKAPLYVPYVVDYCVAYQKSRHSGVQLTILTKYDDGTETCFVYAHLSQLSRLLGNLIENAVEACSSSKTPQIEIIVSAAEGNVLIRVRDNGCGITPENVDRIFDAGFSTKTAHQGQGLASCRHLAEDMRGTIFWEGSPEGCGTTIVTSIPRTAQPQWFITRISIRPSDVLVFIDDEEDMHDNWRTRFEERFRRIAIGTTNSNIRPKFEYVNDPAVLRDGKLISEGTHFFVDYRLKNHSVDGLSLIEEHRLASRSVLVTNHFHNPQILKRAIDIGVPVLPKEFLASISFDIEIGG